jgi:uracil phosphoribosyltransferase
MNEVTVIDHPLVQHNLTVLRNRRTRPEAFRHALGVVASLMVYEATRHLDTRFTKVTTPMGQARGQKLSGTILLVPILRAGLGMLLPILHLIPDTRVGFIGLKRNERSLKASTYHQSLPHQLDRHAILVIDPMLATGGSAVAALDLLGRRGARKPILVNLVAAPQGIAKVHKKYPAVPIYTAAIDERLDDRGYIVPGLGDAGDRLFGVE